MSQDKKTITSSYNMSWQVQNYDARLTIFINKMWGKKRRQKMFDEINAYHDRVIEREHRRVAEIIGKKFKQSEKSVLKLLKSEGES